MGKTEHLVQRTLTAHKGGRRIWLEGKRLRDVGFNAGVRYQLVPSDDALVLRLTPAGDHKVSHKQGRPVIDLITRTLGDVSRAQVTFSKRSITVALHPMDALGAARTRRLNARLAAGQPLRLGSVCHGGGVATDALLRGLGRSALTLAIEQDEHYIRQSLDRGPLSGGGMSVEADLGDLGSDPVALAQLPEVDVLEAGLPCISASRAGRSRKHLAQAEDDDATADLAHAFLNVVAATRPATIVLENVPEYAATASASMIRRNLSRLGYTLSETILDGAAWALEARVRWILVASSGDAIDLEGLVGGPRPATLGEVLDKRPTGWRSTASLQAKAAKDKAAGRGFSRGRKLLEPSATTVPTLRRGYQKGGSCDVRLAHPTRANVARLFSAAEHARIKGIPAALVAGLSEKKAHEVLGQSVISPAFVALGALVVA